MTVAEPRLLACDIDGTLLDSQGHLRPRVYRAVDRIRASGVEVVLATGRSTWGMRDVCDVIGLTGPQIAMQGGLIASPVTGETLLARELGPEDVAKHLAFAREIGVEALLCTADGYRAERRLSTNTSNALAAQLRREASRFEVVASLEDEDEGEDADAPRAIRTVLLTAPADNIAVRTAARHRFGSRYSIVRSDEHAVELLAPGTHKGSALECLAARFGIPMSRVAAVGDGWNDLEMLQAAGLSAAMASAPDEVQSAATMVVPSSDDDGVLVAFRRFFPGLRSTEPSWAPAHRWVTRTPVAVGGPELDDAVGRRVTKPRR
jgi:5-amino-6-(5-phospho-D-ribitylamino)uracil phosphatase